MRKKIILLIGLLLITNIKYSASEFTYNEDYVNNNSIDYIEDSTYDNNYSLEDSDIKMAENDYLILYFNNGSANVTIYDKNSDYYWLSSPREIKGDVNDYYKGMLSSPVIITYIDTELNEKTLPLLTDGNEYSYDMIENGFTLHTKFLDEISIDINFTLLEDELVIDIPFDKIEDGETINLVSIEVLPFLGNSYQDEIPGYFVVPEGVGQLMEFKESDPTIKSPYEEPVYGGDFGIDLDNYKFAIYAPLIGSIHGQHDQAISRYVTNGSQNIDIIASPAGYITGYNYETFKYNYRYQYTLKLSEEKFVKQYTDMYEMNFGEHISFLSEDNADYVGVIKEYRNYLESQGIVISENEYSYKMILETYMQTVKEKAFSTDGYMLTTFEDIVNIDNQLKENGVNAQFVLNTYNKGASNNQLGSSNKISRNIQTGMTKDEFEEKASSQNIDYRYMLDLSTVNDGAKGFSSRKDFSKSMSKDLIKYCVGSADVCDYIISSNTVLTHITNESSNPIDGEKISIILPYVFTNENSLNDKVTYFETTDEILSLFNEYDFSVQLRSILTNKGATEIFDVPHYSSEYSYFDGEIPMLPLLLTGNSALYSEVLNFEITDENLMLKLIEYDIYPRYSIVSEDLSSLNNDILQIGDYQTFDILFDNIVKVNNFVSPAFEEIGNSQMINHQVVSEQLVKVDYSNGVSILINYNNDTQSYDGIEVDAKSYEVIGS